MHASSGGSSGGRMQQRGPRPGQQVQPRGRDRPPTCRAAPVLRPLRPILSAGGQRRRRHEVGPAPVRARSQGGRETAVCSVVSITCSDNTEQCSSRGEKREGMRGYVRGAGADSHDALVYVLVPVSGVIFYTKSDKYIIHSTTTRLK